MGKTKERGRYQSISLSVDFIEEIKKYVIHNPKYRSVADFARDAILEKMDRELKKAKQENETFVQNVRDSNPTLANMSREDLDKLIDESLERKLKKKSSNGNGHGLE